MNIYETLLLFALVCALSAFFVMWAKWEEEKLKTREERDRRWDEISLRLNVENELEQSKEREKRTAQSVQWYAGQLVDCERKRREANRKNRDLQDRLSSILCPSNNHIWKDGRCAKCGRVKYAEIH